MTQLTAMLQECKTRRAEDKGWRMAFDGYDFSACPLQGVKLESIDFIRCSFREADMKHTKIISCSFRECSLAFSFGDNSYIKACSFTKNDLARISFCGAELVDCSFRANEGANALFNRALLSDVRFTHDNFTLSRWKKAAIKKAFFYACDLTDSTFHASIITNSAFPRAQLDGALFNHAKISHSLFHGASLRYADFFYATLKNPDFTGAPDLHGTYGIPVATASLGFGCHPDTLILLYAGPESDWLFFAGSLAGGFSGPKEKLIEKINREYRYDELGRKTFLNAAEYLYKQAKLRASLPDNNYRPLGEED